MINKIIQEQLNKLQVAKLGEYDPFKHMYVIPKYKEPHYDVDHCYLVCLDDTLLTATGNEMLVSNWNNGRYPVHRKLRHIFSELQHGVPTVLGNGLTGLARWLP